MPRPRAPSPRRTPRGQLCVTAHGDGAVRAFPPPLVRVRQGDAGFSDDLVILAWSGDGLAGDQCLLAEADLEDLPLAGHAGLACRAVRVLRADLDLAGGAAVARGRLADDGRAEGGLR